MLRWYLLYLTRHLFLIFLVKWWIFISLQDNLNISDLNVDNKEAVNYDPSYFDRNATAKRNLSHSYSMSYATSREFSVSVHVGNEFIMLSGSNPNLLKVRHLISAKLNICSKLCHPPLFFLFCCCFLLFNQLQKEGRLCNLSVFICIYYYWRSESFTQ